MPPATWNLDWQSSNAARRYPLADSATCTDQGGDFQIPDDFLIECDLPTNASMDMLASRMFIRQLGAYPTGYSLVISCDTEDGYVDVAMAMIPASGFQPNSCYPLGGIAPYGDVNGKVVIGRLDTIAQQPAGLWEFTPDATQIEPDCVRPILSGVQSITVVNGTNRSVPLTGDIELIAGSNMRIWPSSVNGVTQIRFDAISGEGTVRPCTCTNESTTTPICSINGIPVGSDRNFELVVDACLDLTPIENGLKITDKCSTPCCSCTELAVITRDLERFNSERATLESFAQRLSASATQIEMIIMNSHITSQYSGNIG